MLPNVIPAFTWIGWRTSACFKMALLEWLAMVPSTRICWGSDSINPESVGGTDTIVRRRIAETLETANLGRYRIRNLGNHPICIYKTRLNEGRPFHAKCVLD